MNRVKVKHHSEYTYVKIRQDSSRLVLDMYLIVKKILFDDKCRHLTVIVLISHE
jgi:hypothetical protein